MRYFSNLDISFSLPVDGVDKRFRFTPCAKGGSMYIAKSDDEVKALEASGMYGRIYRRMEAQPGQESGEAGRKRGGRPGKAARPKDVEGIGTWQEAIEYLVDKCGSDREKLTAPDEISAEASAKGVRFPNINRPGHGTGTCR